MRKLIAIAVLLMTFGYANANTFCYGPISQVSVTPDGHVTVNAQALASSHVYLCSVVSDANGVTTAACKAVLSVLLAAKATGSNVEWAFTDSIACGQRAAWQQLANWYWGPNQM